MVGYTKASRDGRLNATISNPRGRKIKKALFKKKGKIMKAGQKESPLF